MKAAGVLMPLPVVLTGTASSCLCIPPSACDFCFYLDYKVSGAGTAFLLRIGTILSTTGRKSFTGAPRLYKKEE